MSLVTVTKCPYCVSVVAIDPLGVVAPARAGCVRCLPEGVDYVVFEPDRLPVGPCHHLVLFGACAQWDGHEGDGREVVIRHPALVAIDPAWELTDIIWSAQDRIEEMPHPSFHFVREDADGMAPDHRGQPRLHWRASLDAVFASDAEEFIARCVERHARRER
ncbi:MAG: hypothetical protein K8U57_02040 [Planctomycetes bacterium]|nr:hypothetical protein [Planctomycetota bacterium]